MEYSNQGSLCKYSSHSTNESSKIINKIKADQSRLLEDLIDRHSNEFTINFNVNIGPNVNLKIPTRNFNPTQEEKEFFKKKLKVIKKTELCKNWELYKNCFYKDNCSFAHGEHELRRKPTKEDPRYRTKPCKSFFETMYCSFGSRCQYKHSRPIPTYKENLYTFSAQLHLMLLHSEHSDNFDLFRTLDAAQSIRNLKR
jgi:hypothetical protein